MSSVLSVPIRLYLDTSDFSNHTDSKVSNNPDLQLTRQELITLREQKILEIRFSLFHILEAAHVDEASKPYALERASLIKSLCGNNAFLHPTRLYLHEVLAIAGSPFPADASLDRTYAYVENDDWLPQEVQLTARKLADSFVKGLRNRIKAQTTQVINEQGNRSERRKLSRIFTKKGELTSEGLKVAASCIDMFSTDWKQDYPLTERFWKEEMPFKALRREISSELLRRECAAGIADPVNFVRWCVDRIPSANSLKNRFRELGKQGTEVVQELRHELEERLSATEEFMTGIMSAADVDKGDQLKIFESVRRELRSGSERSLDIKSLRAEHLRRFLEEHRGWLAEHAGHPDRWEARILSSSIGSLPAFDTSIEIAARYFADNGALRDMPRKVSHSDVGDILHYTYIPYVDVFRADDYIRPIATKTAKRFGTTLAKSLPEAIKTVKTLAEERGISLH
jgi:hypothetical protein